MKSLRYLVAAIFSIWLLATPPLFAQEEPVICNGDRVEYFTKEKKVIGKGNVVVTYKDMRLECEEATVYLETKETIASGNVTLYDGESIFRAEKISYNFVTQKGTLIKGDAKIRGELATKFWYGKGEEIEKFEEKEYHIKTGYITTCDLDPPHYRIQSKEIRIYLDDRVTAKHVFFLVGNFSLFYLPYYSQSLKDNRPSVTVIPGKKKEWGLFALSKWKYYFNEGSKGYIHLDWRELRGWAEGLDYDYKTTNFGEGAFRIYHIMDLDRQKDPAARSKRSRYRAQLRHRWDAEEGMFLVAEYHRLKDKSIIKDFFEREYEEQSQPESLVALIRLEPSYSLGLEWRKRTNRFFSVTERLPELSLDVPERKLWGTDFYYENNTSLVNLNRKIVAQVGTGEDDISLTEDRDAVRLDTYNELSYVKKLLGWLDIKPYVGTRQIWYSKDSSGDEGLMRGVFYTGAKLSSRFYRIFDIDGNFLGIEVNKLRHLIEPSIDYNYIPHPTVASSRILQFDSIDSISHSDVLTLTLENKLQTKRKVGDEMVKIDLADLTVSTNYLPDEDEISNIEGKLELRPYDWLVCESDVSYNHHRGKVETFNVDLIAAREKLGLGLGHRYLEEESSQLTTEVAYQPIPRVRFRTYHRYNFTEKDMLEQEYAVQFDLHCWVAEVTYNIRDAETIWFVLYLKAFPELPFSFSTTYHEPNIGSQGPGWSPTPKGRRLLGSGF